ncbi:unnamed protein product [Allacma fusca]|uniref:Uncharacterized protein n=1 Tax=Allacma fusca TaxID=39272 RepID=A0A8J2ME62_9HEXA|nr:unnamed protein product [Allacma fusca]
MGNIVNLVQSLQLVSRAVTFNAIRPLQTPNDESSADDSLKTSNLLASRGVVYLVRNVNDGSILTASATLSANCVYQVSGVTSVRSIRQENRNWLRYTDDSRQQLTTQLWEISYTDKTLFLQPATLAVMNKWIWRESNPGKPMNGDLVSQESESMAAPQLQPLPDGRNPEYVDFSSKEATTLRKKKRGLDYHSSLAFLSQRGPAKCDLSHSKIMWKSQWEIFDLEAGSNIKGEQFQIRDIRGKCVQSGGFIGICPQRRLESDSNSSWQIHPVADLSTIP